MLPKLFFVLFFVLDKKICMGVSKNSKQPSISTKRRSKMTRMKSSIGIAALVLIVSSVLVSGTIWAGDLEPSAPPAPTMKTLDQIPPTWSQKLPASTRFVLVLDGAGVLDKETGLVWEQSPSTDIAIWDVAARVCLNLIKGGRKGWRMPAINELTSLIDPTNSNPALPTGHPFSSIQGEYWSVTSTPGPPIYTFALGIYSGYADMESRSDTLNFWCVRGGNASDFYRP